MKDELPKQAAKAHLGLDERFAGKPHVRERLIEIADMMDRLVAQGCTADQAEEAAIEQIRKLGNGILSDWAQKSERAPLNKARAVNAILQP